MFRAKLIKAYEEKFFSAASLKEGWQDELKAEFGDTKQLEVIEDLDLAFADDRFTASERAGFSSNHWPIGGQRFAAYENYAWSNWAAKYYQENAATLSVEDTQTLMTKLLSFQPDNLDASFAATLGEWLLTSGDADVRAKCAAILAKMGPRASSGVPHLVMADLLHNESPTRVALVRIGVTVEQEAEILARKLTEQSDPYVRLKMVERIAIMGPRFFNDEAARILKTELNGKGGRAHGPVDSAAAQRVLTIVRRFGTRAAGLIPDVTHLQCHLYPDDSACRAALDAMGATQGQRLTALNAVFENAAEIANPAQDPRLNAISLIVAIGPDHLAEIHKEFALSTLDDVTALQSGLTRGEQAGRILVLVPEWAKERKNEILDAEMNHPGRADFPELLSAIGVTDAEHKAYLASVLETPERANDHAEAAIRLTEFGTDGFAVVDAKHADVLKKALGYSDHSQRLCAALEKLGPQAAAYRPTLYRLSLEYTTVSHFNSALQIIGMTPGQEAELLVSILQDKSAVHLRDNACLSVAKLGAVAAKAIPALTTLLENEDGATSAALALGAIGTKAAGAVEGLTRARVADRIGEREFTWTLNQTGADRARAQEIIRRTLSSLTGGEFVASLELLKGLGELSSGLRDLVTARFFAEEDPTDCIYLYIDLCRVGQNAVDALKTGATRKISSLSGNPSQVGASSERTAVLFLELNYGDEYRRINVTTVPEPSVSDFAWELKPVTSRLPLEPLYDTRGFEILDLTAGMMNGIGGLLGSKGTQIGSGGLGARGSGLGGGGTAEGLGGLGTRGRGSGASGYGSGGGNFGSRGTGYDSVSVVEPEFTLKPRQSYSAHQSDFAKIMKRNNWTCDESQSLAIQALLILAAADKDESSVQLIREFSDTDANGAAVREAARYALEYADPNAKTKYRRVYKATSIVLGSLDKSLIDAVIKRHMSEIRYLYQRELIKNPSLSGEIVVKFVIAGDGTVPLAVIESSTMNNESVESGICARFMSFQFPEPKGGGIVEVTYPFRFAPG